MSEFEVITLTGRVESTTTMVHTSKVYKYASYEEYRDNGMFSSEANCTQFLYDLKILRTNHQCPRCCVPMAPQECPATKYREGFCISVEPSGHSGGTGDYSS